MANLIRWLALVLLAGVSGAAHAEVVSALAYIGSAIASAVGSTAFVVAVTAISIASSVYSSNKAKRAAREEAQKKLMQDIANMQDRTIMVLQNDAPHQVIYGSPAKVSGSVAAMLTSGAGAEYTHILVIFAAHECDAIEEIYLEDTPVLAGEDGWTTNTDLIRQPSGVYDFSSGPMVHIGLHLSPGGVDTADQWLIDTMNAPLGGFPGANLWTAAHKLSGYTYAIVTVNKVMERFQGGPPNITAKIRGKKVYDPRTGVTAFSRNPALIMGDFLRSIQGYSSTLDQIEMNAWIACANACDEEVFSGDDLFNTGGSTARYVCDGMFRSDQDRDNTRQQIEDSMAGFSLESGGVWRMQAGAWTTPVMSLGDDDMLAPMVVTQTVESTTNRFNTCRGTYINAAGNGVAEDFAPYVNPTFLSEDGREKAMDLACPFTASHSRAHQLARIAIEKSRGGFTVTIHPKMSAWHLQPGDRIYLTNALYGIENKPFLVTDWAYSREAPLALQAVEDIPEYYDLIDEVRADPTPNSNLPNPFIPPSPPNGLTVESGPNHVLNQSGTLVARARVAWELPTDTRILGPGGGARVQWMPLNNGTGWLTMDVLGDTNEVFLLGLKPGETYIIRVRFQTSWASSSWVTLNHTMMDNFNTPGSVGGLSLTIEPDGVRASWSLPSDLPLVYWSHTSIRIGATFASAAEVWTGRAQQCNLGWMQAGVQTVWAVHVDAIGRESTPVSTSITIQAPAQPVVTGESWRDQVELKWTESKTTQPLTGYEVRLGDTFDSASKLTTLLSLGYVYTQAVPGTYMYWVQAIDLAGNRSAPGYVQLTTLPGIDAALNELQDGLGQVVGQIDELGNVTDALESQVSRIAVGSRPNMLPNGGFEQGTDGWTANVGTISAEPNGPDGPFMEISNLGETGSVMSSTFYTGGSGTVLTASGDILLLGSTESYAYFFLGFFDANGSAISFIGAPSAAVGPQHIFENSYERLQKFALQATAPAGTVTARFFVSWDKSPTRLAVRRLKVELGGLPATPYSAERTNTSTYAAVVQESSIRATETGALQARWGVRVESNGHVSGILLNNDGSQSNFVVQVDRFAVAMNTGAGIKYPFVVGNINGTPSVGIDGNLYIDGTIQTRMLEAQAVTADKIRTGTITAQQIATGSLTADLINVGGGANLIPDAAFMYGNAGQRNNVPGTAKGWSTLQSHPELAAEYKVNGAGAPWHPVGENTLTIYQPNPYWSTNVGGDVYAQHASPLFAVEPNKRYEFSAYTGAQRCHVAVILVFFDASNNYITEGSSDLNSDEVYGGQLLSGYKRIGGFVVAPSNAASAQFIARKRPTLNGNANSWMFLTRPMVAKTTPYATVLSDYVPNGQGTMITPEGITTPSLSALSASLGDISAGRINLNSSDGAWSGIRTNNKWWSDGQWGFVMASEPSGKRFVDYQMGSCRMYMHSDGTAGFVGPGFSLTEGGLTISQLNVIDTLNVRGGAVSTALVASGAKSASIGVTVPANQYHLYVLIARINGGTMQNVDSTTSAITASNGTTVAVGGVRCFAFGGEGSNVNYSFSPEVLVGVIGLGAGSYTFTAAVNAGQSQPNVVLTAIAARRP